LTTVAEVWTDPDWYGRPGPTSICSNRICPYCGWHPARPSDLRSIVGPRDVTQIARCRGAVDTPNARGSRLVVSSRFRGRPTFKRQRSRKAAQFSFHARSNAKKRKPRWLRTDCAR